MKRNLENVKERDTDQTAEAEFDLKVNAGLNIRLILMKALPITWKIMKSKVLLALIFVLLTGKSYANESNEKLFCASFYAFYYKKEVEKLPNDKAMHCTMSCYLAVKCPKEEAQLIGYLKEFWDIFGPGDYDRNDIKANQAGIRLAKRGSKAYCKRECLKRYVRNPKRK